MSLRACDVTHTLDKTANVWVTSHARSDMAVRLGVTRATIASYETGRRKIPAGTLIQLAHLCGKPLTFFAAQRQPAQADPQQAAIQAMVTTLQAHPEFTPFVLEFLETLVHEQVAGVI